MKEWPAWTNEEGVMHCETGNYQKPDEWLKVAEGLEVDGILLRQYDQKNDEGKEQRKFIIQSGHKIFGISEVASLASLRDALNGAMVAFKVFGKKDIGNGRSKWVIEVKYRNPANGKKTFETEALPIS